MIVRDQPQAIKLFFVIQGSIIPQIFGKIIFVFLLTTIVMLLETSGFEVPHISISAMGVFGVALSLFLGFRNNAAYDRWWEARKQWGIIVAEIRTLGRHLELFVVPCPEQEKILSDIVTYAHLHRGRLRNVDVQVELAPWISKTKPDQMITHLSSPDIALRTIAIQLREMANNGLISGFGQMATSKTLSSIGLAQAANERINNTPLPFVYSLLVRRTTYLYCIFLPFALVDAASIFAPLYAAVVAYVFFGLQAVTNELESPFGESENGVPLNALCRSIEISISEILMRPSLPDITPERYVLR